MLWIALYLPGLSLQAHCRGALGQLRDLPLVISDGPANRPLVHAANGPARAAGIATAMPVSSAQAHATELVVVPREPQRETEALRQIATWLTQFTPMVCFESAGVLLEVSTSLTLFGGIAALTQRIRGGVLALNFQPAIGIAPTPRAAYLLARASHYHAGVRMCREAGPLQERLTEVPLALYDWPPAEVQTMAALGFTRVKELLAQPRAGLRKRFDAALMDDLDRSLGLLPDPREPFVPPEQFESRLELLFETADAGRLCHFTQLLLIEMEGFLRARGAAVSAIELSMKHSRDTHTRHDFGARTPQRNAAEWLRLVRERLTAHELPAAVTAISLSARAPQTYVPASESWLPTRHAQQEQWQILLARIASRLGGKRVFGIAAHDDHRPELAWRIDDAHKASKPAGAAKARPLMLLQEPRILVSMDDAPQHHGPLTLLAGPERIETGWWDGRPVARDYFVARNHRQEVCWIYRDYRHGRQWFLHGYFA
ncbi:MAG: DNA polymerase Y family protein [Betaproteobacteria bacterium]|nr:DNA polymerase Y family protein [Betaproteobacteria bacterium]